MKVQVKELDNLVRELSVQVEATQVNVELDHRYTEVRKEAAVDGFRKGKAPMDIIKKRYREQVLAEAADALIRNTLPDAIKEKDLQAAGPPMITDLDFRDDGSLVYSVKLEVFGEIGDIKYDGLEITSIPIEVEDHEVAEMADSVQRAFSEFRDVEREAGADDALIVDLKKTDDPANALKDDVFEDAMVDLGAPMTVREFKEGLVGLRAGDEKEVTVVYPEDYSDTAFAGNTITYHCTVKKVQERVLPEFNDTLAKRTKQAETALELKMKMREDIKRQKTEMQRKINRNQVVGQIVEQNQLELPSGMVEEYLTAVIKDHKESNPEADEKDLRDRFREVAVRTMRWNMLYHQIAEVEKIEVLPADTEKMINNFAAQYNMTAEQARGTLAQTGKMDTVKDTILEDKVLDFLMDKAKVVETKPAKE